ncbi:hypothetical protein ACKFRN_09265 [Corynebacterium kefirresidentii]|uniref:hypothetical protein n=1 Tax=Corynebacterium kefirresidentii TaxID=1979527 RepID=UPI0038D14126
MDSSSAKDPSLQQPQISEEEKNAEGTHGIDETNFPTSFKEQTPSWMSGWLSRVFRRHPKKEHRPTREELEKDRYKADTRYRTIYAKALLAILFFQLVVAHIFLYKIANGPHQPDAEGFYLSDQVIIAYLTSIVVEVIGLVYGIVRGIYLLPERK